MLRWISMRVKKAPWWGDYIRSTDDYTNFVLHHFVRDFILQHRLRYMIYFRYSQTVTSSIVRLFCQFKMLRMSRKYGIEIQTPTQIGEGFLMVHPYNITISPEARLGRNVNMLKGATVGKSEGRYPGVPVIGNDVYIGLNATVLGGITIGDDVLIGPNAVVNRDVPSHCIVVGNPCKIIHRENATKEYLSYKVEY